MKEYKFFRLVRTPTSEEFIIWDGILCVGHIHIHYVRTLVYMSLILEVDLTDEEREGLVLQIDDIIISSYMPSFERENLLVTIYRAKEIDSFVSNYNDYEDEED